MHIKCSGRPDDPSVLTVRRGGRTPRWVSFDELLGTSDVVSMHASLNGRSRGMMGAAEFKKMKPSAYFINMSRGGVFISAPPALSSRVSTASTADTVHTLFKSHRHDT